MFSIIVPCHNEEDYIPLLLKSLEEQILNKKYFEIIIVDNASTDNTKKIVLLIASKSNLNIKLIEEPSLGVSKARNTGAQYANYNILIFLDADNTVSNLFLQNVLYIFNNSSIGASTIKTLAEPTSIKGTYVFIVLEVFKRLLKRPFGKSIVRKEIFELSGGYNEDIKLGENVEFLIRIKHVCTKEKKQFIHCMETINCSLRRFDKLGYIKILSRWLFAYLGYWKMSYQTLPEINK